MTRELDVAIEAVRQASLLCRSVRASFSDDLATAKADRSPVTVADLGSQALISLHLAEAFPTDRVMGEEDATPVRGHAAPAVRDAVLACLRTARPTIQPRDIERLLDRCGDTGGPTERWWTLDPVDGTKGFLRDEQYAVALALIEDGEVILGVLGCPNLARTGGGRGVLFAGERGGGGAWELPLDDATATAHRIAVAAVTDPREARYVESVEAAHSGQDDASRIGATLGITEPPIRIDSQAKYGLVARGDASIYLRIPRGGYQENVWDHAAGSIVVTEAGGVVSDLDGSPLDFTTGRRLTRNRGIIAAPPAIHARVVDAARDVLGVTAG